MVDLIHAYLLVAAFMSGVFVTCGLHCDERTTVQAVVLDLVLGLTWPIMLVYVVFMMVMDLDPEDE